MPVFEIVHETLLRAATPELFGACGSGHGRLANCLRKPVDWQRRLVAEGNVFYEPFFGGVASPTNKAITA
jgi:hypothetical protein